MKKKFVIFILTVFCIGCEEQKKPLIIVNSEPLKQVQKDPDVNFDKYNNFSVSPIAEFVKDSKMDPITEKQLLFLIINYFECLAYNYVQTLEEADFYVEVYYTNEYKSEYIPPSLATVPMYVPGQTYRTNMNLYNSRGGNSWGTATTTTRGSYVPMTYTRPGYYIGAYYPLISVSVFDKKTKKVVWSGRAVTSTPERDIRLSGQNLLEYIFIDEDKPSFPEHKDFASKKNDVKNEVLGFSPYIYTLDGNNFYPTIISIRQGSPADKQRLKIYDTIIHIDGISTLNKSLSEILEAMNKNKGEQLMLTIERGNKVFNVCLLAEYDTVAANWKKYKCPDGKGNVITKTIPVKP